MEQLRRGPRAGFVLLMAALAAVVTACYLPVSADDPYLAPVYPADEITVVPNVVYGQGVTDTGVDIDLLVDFHIPPDNGERRPTLAVIHGGGFTIGTAADRHPEALEYARRGFVVATPTYRLVSERPDFLLDSAPGLDAASDIQLFMKWLRDNADTYSVDPNRIALSGVSAGGTAALVAAQSTDFAEGRTDSDQSHIPTAVFATGPATLPTLLSEGLIRPETAAAPALIHHHEFDNVVNSIGDDARFTCLVWSSEPSTHRCTPTIFEGEGHIILVQPGDSYWLNEFMPFLSAELDLANAANP